MYYRRAVCLKKNKFNNKTVFNKSYSLFNLTKVCSYKKTVKRVQKLGRHEL